MGSPTVIKQIMAGRRKPNMTRKEYFDHRYRIHGEISDRPQNPDDKPFKYIQTQVFDSAYGGRKGVGPPNANHAWVGRDDVTELFFRDWDHLLAVFNSDYINTVKADAPFFADFETAISLMVYEQPISISTNLSKSLTHRNVDKANSAVALYFIGTEGNDRLGAELEKSLSPSFVSALEKHASDDVWAVVANIGTESSKFDLSRYFGGGQMPQFALVYKVFLEDNASVPAFRKAQAAFTASVGSQFDQSTSFVLFGHEGLILDLPEGIKFDPSRQPVLLDLPGPSHLD